MVGDELITTTLGVFYIPIYKDFPVKKKRGWVYYPGRFFWELINNPGTQNPLWQVKCKSKLRGVTWALLLLLMNPEKPFERKPFFAWGNKTPKCHDILWKFVFYGFYHGKWLCGIICYKQVHVIYTTYTSGLSNIAGLQIATISGWYLPRKNWVMFQAT